MALKMPTTDEKQKVQLYQMAAQQLRAER